LALLLDEFISVSHLRFNILYSCYASYQLLMMLYWLSLVAASVHHRLQHLCCS